MEKYKIKNKACRHYTKYCNAPADMPSEPIDIHLFTPCPVYFAIIHKIAMLNYMRKHPTSMSEINKRRYNDVLPIMDGFISLYNSIVEKQEDKT